ncbi:MAG: urease accessory protein UreD [Oceanisphaera sp.]|uniref:urease accessory protein UreD n=1 Tax=Oceanisphaera sp. TaxID=1929979 RepID=UPI003F993020
MSATQSLAPQGYGADRKWFAKLELKLVPFVNKTHLKQLAFVGPLRIQRPFYPEDGVCHLYILHPPGGLVSGDKLHIHAHCSAHSQSLLTTPSAGKIYGQDSDGVVQGQTVHLQLADNAECEWLPQETLIFNNANAELDTRIELADTARFIGWDLVCLGRPASDAPFHQGQVKQRIRVWRNERLVLNEHVQLSAGSELQQARVGFAGNNVFGTLLATGVDFEPALLEQLRQLLPSPEFSLTQRLGVLLVRYLGDNMNECRAGMWQAWRVIRPVLLMREVCIPRIWLT